MKKIENFRCQNFSFSCNFQWKISWKNRDFSISKIFVGRFQHSLIMVLINRFGQNFVQNYVEFNGGGRGIKIQANPVSGRPVQKKSRRGQKKSPFPFRLSTERRFGVQLSPSLPYVDIVSFFNVMTRARVFFTFHFWGFWEV